ncbi:YtrH family sporulation protein [Bacillaceae bacterium S4-13-58]
MEERFIVSVVQCYFIALGVIVGGAFIGSIGAFLVGEAPMTSIKNIAKGLRIWAIVAAIGGTFDAISNFQVGLFEGETLSVIKQVGIIISAMAGVQTAFLILEWYIQEEIN